jgi:MFS family permease
MPIPVIGQNGRIFIFGLLSAIGPLSIDIYLPALPMLRNALSANEAQTLFTLSAFFIGFGAGQLVSAACRPRSLCRRVGRVRPGDHDFCDRVLAFRASLGRLGRADDRAGDGARLV